MLAIGLTLYSGRRTFAWALEAVLLAALAALIFGGFCLGSYLFLLFTGQVAFANRTPSLVPYRVDSRRRRGTASRP
jgi:hypothetical protein